MTDADSELYEKAVMLVHESGKASVSWVQRRLLLPYRQAQALVARMEVDGHVSAEGIGGSRVVVDSELARTRFLAAEQKRIEARIKELAPAGELYGCSPDCSGQED